MIYPVDFIWASIILYPKVVMIREGVLTLA